MPRMRTIQEAHRCLKEMDHGTAMTPYAIRRLILNGEIPCIKAGNKYLLDMDNLESYLNNPQAIISQSVQGIRRIIPEK